jgi:hypothetical protein
MLILSILVGLVVLDWAPMFYLTHDIAADLPQRIAPADQRTQLEAFELGRHIRGWIAQKKTPLSLQVLVRK